IEELERRARAIEHGSRVDRGKVNVLWSVLSEDEEYMRRFHELLARFEERLGPAGWADELNRSPEYRELIASAVERNEDALMARLRAQGWRGWG
ncbi:MAG: hypothetical protein ACRDTR_03185, partial [Rubrobacter sp.]